MSRFLLFFLFKVVFIKVVVVVVHLGAFSNLSNDFPARFVYFHVRAVERFVGSFLQPSQRFAELVTDELRLFFAFSPTKASTGMKSGSFTYKRRRCSAPQISEAGLDFNASFFATASVMAPPNPSTSPLFRIARIRSVGSRGSRPLRGTGIVDILGLELWRFGWLCLAFVSMF